MNEKLQNESMKNMNKWMKMLSESVKIRAKKEVKEYKDLVKCIELEKWAEMYGVKQVTTASTKTKQKYWGEVKR